MDITAVLDKAEQSATPSTASTEAPATVETAPEAQTAPEPEAKSEVKPDSELTPEQLAKRESNRLAHLNSKLAKMRRENRELRELSQKISQQPSQQNTSAAPQPPSEDNFQTWDEFRAAERKYYEELADWKIEQKLSEREKKTTESKINDEHALSIQQRNEQIAQQEEEFSKANPEYIKLIEQHIDFFNPETMPEHVKEALRESENGTLAVFALMKEGRLYELEDMSPYRLAMEIGKAEIRGESYLNQKKATNAPSPMRGAKGITTSKPLSGKEALAMLKR